MTISFIIPVYNGREYIVRCLNSIYSTDIPLDDFEIIVVDDCSTDDTYSIVESYMETHSQVKLLRQSRNNRQGAARNRGIREASGEYVSFIDSDDLVLPELRKSYELAIALSPDMIFGFMEIEESKGFHLLHVKTDTDYFFSGAEFVERYCEQGVFYYPPSYLYRRRFLFDINGFFVEGRQHEDRDWLAYVLSEAASVVVNPNPIYRYMMNPNSTCRALRFTTVSDHVASGMRHIELSSKLSHKCPTLSRTLYFFGQDEISKSLRLRHLSKFSWHDIAQLYDDNHLKPLLVDLRRICRAESLPFAVRVVAFAKPIEMTVLAVVSPIAKIGRIIVRNGIKEMFKLT